MKRQGFRCGDKKTNIDESERLKDWRESHREGRQVSGSPRVEFHHTAEPEMETFVPDVD